MPISVPLNLLKMIRLNKIYPGEFRYGGGHVIEDLLRGKKLLLEAKAYGTDCYAAKKMKKEVGLDDLPYALLCNPRNGYQNYNCAVNLSDKAVYTYMGMFKPNCRNANYCSAGELSPLLNDPFIKPSELGPEFFLAVVMDMSPGGGPSITHMPPGTTTGCL